MVPKLPKIRTKRNILEPKKEQLKEWVNIIDKSKNA